MLDSGWNGLDLRHLAAFEAVAATRSFARAAGLLGYTQPAVSQQVASLERIVGQRLFERSSGRATAALTPAGTLLLGHVAAVGSELSSAHAELRDLARGESGTLRVGAFQTVAACLLPELLRRYVRDRPAVRLELREALSYTELLDAVEAGELDLTFALEPVDRRRFDVRHLLDDPFVLVRRAGEQPLATPTTVAELADLPLIVHRACPAAEQLLDRLRDGGREPRVVFRSDDNGSIKALVRGGIGAAVLPRMWIDLGDNDDLDVTPLAHLLAPRSIVIATRSGAVLTAAQEAFATLARRLHPPV